MSSGNPFIALFWLVEMIFKSSKNHFYDVTSLLH